MDLLLVLIIVGVGLFVFAVYRETNYDEFGERKKRKRKQD